MNEMKNLPRRIGSKSVDRRGSGGACAACAPLCGNTEPAASIVDIGAISFEFN